MNSKKLGIITLGHAPRHDVVPDMAGLIGSGVEIIERGGLDGLTREQAASYAPEPGQFQLITPLNDGGEIVIAKEKIIPRIAQAIADLNKLGADAIILLCTGPFPPFRSRCLVIEPERVMKNLINALLPENGRLGIIVPLPNQIEWAQDSYAGLTKNVRAVSASPYSDEKHLARQCQALREFEPDLVFLNCMGFNQEKGRLIRRLIGRPVLISSSMVARTAGELMGEA